MNEHEISTPEQLDVALNAGAIRKRAQLWKIAEGRSLKWAEVIGFVCAVLFLAIGIARGFTQDASAAIQLALGVLMVAAFFWSRMQRQLNALVEVVKSLEREHPSASRGP
jgi:phosphotransferase system  glucose/maltose/N-acetylglucosamine-specific IIC component